MADQLGSAVLTLSVDDRQYNAGLQRAKQTADTTLGSLGRQGGSVGAISSGFAGLGLSATTVAASVAAIGIAVAGIGVAAVQTAGGIQKLNASFTGLTGSAEAAKQLRQDLFTLSKTTPFKNEEILQAAQRFLAVGVSVDNLQGTINRVGAIAAQSGQPLERLALIYAQVYAKGRLQGEENLQLLEAGVDLTQELSQVTGLSGRALQDAMSKGQIGIDKFNAALKLATGDMSALRQAGQAVDVQFNNIFDNISQLFGGVASSIAPALSAAFGVINQIFDQAFPSLASIEEVFAPLTAEARRFSDVLAGNPELISAIAAAVREWAALIVDGVAFGLQTVSNILSKIDATQLVQSFVNVEIIVRRVLLAAQALGATLVKNAELTIRAASNPIQFGKDIIGAGGFVKFIQNEYKAAGDAWNQWANSKPLEIPKTKDSGTADMAGGLDNKLVNASETTKNNLIEAYNAAARSAERIVESAAKAKVDLLALQGSPDQGLNRFLGSDLAAQRRQQSASELGPFVEQAIRDASGILAKQNLRLPAELVGELRRTTEQTTSRIVGEINGRQLFAAPEAVSQPQLQTQIDFIRAVEEEKAAISSARDAQIELAKSVRDLVEKNWAVNVNINADGSGVAYGDVVNGALSQ